MYIKYIRYNGITGEMMEGELLAVEVTSSVVEIFWDHCSGSREVCLKIDQLKL